MRFRGPLANSYPAAVALVVFCLVPFLMLTAAVFPLMPELTNGLGMSEATLYLIFGMADGAYSFGTVMAVQFAVHLPGRRMLLLYVSAFVAAAALAAWAPTHAVFFAAFIVEGLCTSLMLIAAVPPLVIGWPPEKMPWTGMAMNLCIFGAVAAGPSIGAFEASAGQWRPLFWGVTGLGVLALLFALLTFEDQPPQDKGAPWDLVAIGLAAGGCGAAFYGASELEAGLTARPGALAPLIGGFLMIVGLVVYEYRSRRPLMPVKQLATTFPVVGITIALSASASSFGLMELTLLVLSKGSSITMGLVFLPEIAAAFATAALFALLFRTRFTPLLAFGGMLMIVTSAAVLSGMVGGSAILIGLGTGLVGLGVGASVSPALFLAGFSLRSSQIQRVFALIELMRGVTAFLLAPILVYLAETIASTEAAGIEWTVWICLGIAALGGMIAFTIFRLGRTRLQAPDLDTWEKADEPAWESPPLLAGLRERREAAPSVSP